MASIPSPLIAEARKRWTRCAEAEDQQRKRILLAKKFRAGDQWDEALKRQRQGASGIAGVPPQPARPCLVVDRLSQPIRQISNTIKNADFGFNVSPNGGGADLETAKIYKGYLRRVQNQARGESPIEWAADGAIEGGLGWFRLRTEYVYQTWDGPPSVEMYDQELRMERLTNNLSVYCDPAAQLPTRSDAIFMFVVDDLSKDAYIDLYGEEDLRGLEEFQSTGDMAAWVDKDIIRIAEYWRIVYQERTFHELDNGTIIEAEKKKPAGVKRSRTLRVPQVKCDKINAIRSLEAYDWVGSRIPLIPILGEELNVDGQIVLRGIIEEGMDAQRMVNYTYSGAMELFALEPKAPWVADAESIADYKAQWDTSNTVNYAALFYDSKGGTRPMPTRTDRRGDGIVAAVSLMQTSEQAIKATTSTGDASLGNSHPSERSGRAIQSLQAASDLANNNYPDNTRRAVIYAAELALEVIPKITRPGQVLQILGLDDQPQQVMVGKPFAPNANGVPEAAPDHITPEIAKLQDNLYRFYDLNSGRYAVTVTVGKATATKREEGAAALGELIPHLPPEMAAVATPDYVEQLDFPGSGKIADKLRKVLPPQLQDTPPDPAQLMQMVQQLSQQNQQLQQAIATDQAKEQIKLQGQMQIETLKAQAEAALQIRLKEMDNAKDIEVARIQAAKETQTAALQAQEEAIALNQQLTADAARDAQQQVHERELQSAQHAATERQAQADAMNTEAGV